MTKKKSREIEKSIYNHIIKISKEKIFKDLGIIKSFINYMFQK